MTLRNATMRRVTLRPTRWVAPVAIAFGAFAACSTETTQSQEVTHAEDAATADADAIDGSRRIDGASQQKICAANERAWRYCKKGDASQCCTGQRCNGGYCAEPDEMTFGTVCQQSYCKCTSFPGGKASRDELCCLPTGGMGSCTRNSECATEKCDVETGECQVSEIGGPCFWRGNDYVDGYFRGGDCTSRAHCGGGSSSNGRKTCCLPDREPSLRASDCCSKVMANGACGCVTSGSAASTSGVCCSKVLVNGVCQ